MVSWGRQWGNRFVPSQGVAVAHVRRSSRYYFKLTIHNNQERAIAVFLRRVVQR